MTGIEELDKIEKCEMDIKKLDDEIALLEHLSKSPTGSNLESNYNPNKNTESKQVVYLEELEQKRNDRDRLVEQIEANKQSFLNKVIKLENPKYKAALIYKYIDGRTWGETSTKMCYAGNHIYKIRKKAIEAYKKMIA